MLKPEFITFTGADDATSVADLLSLSRDHAVEFGILFSRKREGTARYPAAEWMKGLKDTDLTLAAHVCGDWAAQIVRDGRSDIDDRLAGFGRIQINTDAWVDLDLVLDWAGGLSQKAGREIAVILQSRGAFPEDARFHWLEDRSGGRGVAPESWPDLPLTPGVRCGFAGGLGPHNVGEVLPLLPDAKCAWIDMESRVRDSANRFDITQCRQVCEICEEVAAAPHP